MTYILQNLKNLYQKSSTFVNNFITVTVYNINIKKISCFIYSCCKCAESEINKVDLKNMI